MKLMCTYLFAFVFIVASVPASAAGAAQDRNVLRQQVHFERGRTSTVIKNTIRRGTTHEYLLAARGGQTMIVHLVAKQTSFTIYKPNGGAAIESADGVKDWEGSLPETGEYTITISTDARSAPYTLETTIR
ncbi:MAG: hypothetical protein DMF64_13070 [Acidobacteria bacterium]|nr:MAG: hypothetical protein DMF64_13070 [Acidobacteriota bacterium]